MSIKQPSEIEQMVMFLDCQIRRMQAERRRLVAKMQENTPVKRVRRRGKKLSDAYRHLWQGDT